MDHTLGVAPMTVRRAAAADSALLADLGARTFTEAFGHLYPAADLATFLAGSHAPEALDAYLSEPATAAWIMQVGGEAVGYALAGPCGLPHPEVTAACGELKRLYMLAAWRGGGRGSRLLETALSWLAQTGRSRVWIGVWSENVAAQRLYARLGFDKVGEYEFSVGRTRDREFILRRG